MTKELENEYKKYESEELLKIANNPQEYTIEAVEIAILELKKRDISFKVILSSNKILNADLIKIILNYENLRVDYELILNEIKKRNIWNNFSIWHENEINPAIDEILNSIKPGTINFSDNLNKLMSIEEINKEDKEIENVILLKLIFKYIYENICNLHSASCG